MRRRFLFLLSFVMLFSLFTGCGTVPAAEGVQVTATVYPVYLVAKTVAEGVPGLTVERMVAETGACVHDYNLSVNDLKKLEYADLLIESGAGLESFLEGLLSRYPDLKICDASQGVETLLGAEHDHGDGHEEEAHEEETDPHIWMDPKNLAVQTQNIADSLSSLLPEYRNAFQKNAGELIERLQETDLELSAMLAPLRCRELITFHEGFSYFARAYGFTVTGIEEEAGSEASALVLRDLIDEIRAHQVPAVFYEKNGSDRSALVLSRETGVPALPLSMLMDGDGTVEGFLTEMLENGRTIAEGYGS